MLRANDGRITKTVINKSLIKNSLKAESFLSGPEAVRTTKIPTIPNIMEAYMNYS